MKNYIKHIIITWPICLLLSFAAKAQTTGEIRGTITDEKNKPMFGAIVKIISDSMLIGGGTTNFDGIYTAKNINPGTYELHISSLGYQTKIIEPVTVSASQKVEVNLKLNVQNDTLPTFEKIVYLESPINKGYSPVDYISSNDIKNGTAPRNDIIGIIGNVSPYATPTNDGKDIYMRGSRRGTTQYIVDGMKTVGGFNVPGGSISNVVVVGSGISAEYGDLTGGVVIITTKDYISAMRDKRLMYDAFYEEQDYINSNLTKKDPNTPKQNDKPTQGGN